MNLPPPDLQERLVKSWRNLLADAEMMIEEINYPLRCQGKADTSTDAVDEAIELRRELNKLPGFKEEAA